MNGKQQQLVDIILLHRMNQDLVDEENSLKILSFMQNNSQLVSLTLDFVLIYRQVLENIKQTMQEWH